MTNPYSKDLWKAFRDEVIELDGRACQRCHRSKDDGAILQVHHKFYVSGKLPWDYHYQDCETLCKGCHSAEHGLTRPKVGWEFTGQEDLGDLCGSCDCCGTQIRYVFYVFHPHWEMMGVGTFCCDHLTGTEIASNHMESVRRFESRRSRFMASSRWKDFGYFWEIRQKRINLRIQKNSDGFQIFMKRFAGKKRFNTVEEAKEFAFNAIEDGSAEKFLAKNKW
ncbi:MAG TPA: HNH endonuclease [Verrucomicrobiae bacterium]|jgi:hypothetical protein|nr:HNH endonuclease [Verrucomicrobiae bacterium]